MIKIRLYNPIANKDNAWWYSWDGEDGVFSLDYVQKVFKENQAETDFQFNIHCMGGEVEEGLAIYDFLRTSGKNIHMNIEGGCHSMAITLLLAAPAENRSANPNAVALMHEVQGCAYGSTSAVEATAHDMKLLQDRILDIYTERTGSDRSVLEAMMKEQKEHGAKELLQLGFISKINSYNTNFKKIVMSKENKKIIKEADSFLNRLKKVFSSQIVNYDFVDDNGEVVFSTESEDDTLELGMAASPDGTFTIADGRTITIEDGVITNIEEKEEEEEETTTTIEEENDNLRNENENLRNMLQESQRIITDLKKEVKSNYVPKGRVGGQTEKSGKSKEATKEELKENFKFAKRK